MHKPRARKIIKLSAVLLVIIVLVGAATVARIRLSVPLPVLQPQVVYAQTTPKPAVALDWPTFGQAAIGTAGYGTLATSGAQTPVPTASIAKLITTLAVLKAKPVIAGSQGATLTFTQSDVDLYNHYIASDGSVVPVSVGEQITEYQTMEALLLPSANNMADSLAIWAFGSLSAYASYANHLVSSLGMTHTHIGSDASGLSADTTSTASDLVILGEVVAADPIIASITNRVAAVIPVAGTIRNVNWLLGKSGINGLKTGNSDGDPGAFLFSAPYEISKGHTVTIVGAVLMAPDLTSAMSAGYSLLTSGQKAFGLTSELSPGQAVARYRSPWGTTTTAASSLVVQSVSWQGVPLDKSNVTVHGVRPPQPSGATVGYIISGRDTIPINLTTPLPAPSIWWRLTHN